MDEQNVVLGGELHSPVEHLLGGQSARGHLGVVHNHHLHTAQVPTLHLLKVGQPTLFGREGVGQGLSTGEGYGRAIGGVAGVGDEHLLALAHKGHTEVHKSLLGAYERQHLGVHIEFHTIVLLVPHCKRFAQTLGTLVGLVDVYIGPLGTLIEGLHHRGVRGLVGRAYAEADDGPACLAQFGNLTQFARKVVLFHTFQTLRKGDVDGGVVAIAHRCICIDLLLSCRLRRRAVRWFRPASG